jgi:hypothetical protein
MIKASYTLNWSGGEYSVRLHRELVKAVQKSGEMVQRTAVKSMSVSGKASLSKASFNKLKTASQRFNAGKIQIKDLKERTTKKGKAFTLTYGGNYITKKGKVDRIYWYGEPLHRWVQSSPPGSPPHKQSGELAKIVVEKVQGGLRAKVGPKQGLIYARIQELGGKAMIRLPARPYMRPAFEQNQQAILFQFALAVQKAAK